jgi:hypothetical protein
MQHESKRDREHITKGASRMKKRKFKIGRQSVVIHAPVEPYASATERASEDDRLWFETHPEATHRIRNYIAGELRDYVPPTHHKILVRQIRRGCRTRTSVPPHVVEAVEQGIELFDPFLDDIRLAVLSADKNMEG